MIDVTHKFTLLTRMIRSYGDNRSERFAKRQRVKPFEPFRRQAEKTLDRLDAATGLRDLANFPGHRLEKLKGDRVGTYSIRINDHGGYVSHGPTDRLDLKA
jgi:proteic killer suppression protein